MLGAFSQNKMCTAAARVSNGLQQYLRPYTMLHAQQVRVPNARVRTGAPSQRSLPLTWTSYIFMIARCGCGNICGFSNFFHARTVYSMIVLSERLLSRSCLYWHNNGRYALTPPEHRCACLLQMESVPPTWVRCDHKCYFNFFPQVCVRRD